MKKNKTLLIGVASAVGIALIALAIFIAYTLNPANKYTRTVTSAEKYYQEGDYQNSILAYEDAIAQDPNNVNAYIGLANVYVDQNQTDMAIATLRRYTGPASSRIDLMLANLLASSGSSEGSSEVTVSTTQTIALNTNLLTVVGGYSYADYSSKFGIASRNSNRDGSVTVRVNTIDGDFNYRNTEFQPNAVSATVVEANTIPASLTLDNATSLFGNVQSVSLDTLQTLNLENYSVAEMKITNDNIFGLKKENDNYVLSVVPTEFGFYNTRLDNYEIIDNEINKIAIMGTLYITSISR